MPVDAAELRVDLEHDIRKVLLRTPAFLRTLRQERLALLQALRRTGALNGRRPALDRGTDLTILALRVALDADKQLEFAVCLLLDQLTLTLPCVFAASEGPPVATKFGGLLPASA